jgi:DNA repair photolyase
MNEGRGHSTAGVVNGSRSLPAAAVEFDARLCGNHVVDLTAGCSFGCVYCPFAEIAMAKRGARRATPVVEESLATLPPPPSVFLSPASDPFAPQAAGRTHALLERWLAAGTVVGIVTKGIIPERTLDLLAASRDRVEGIGVGVSSLDEARNATLEPGCPTARLRLGNLERLAARGLAASLRMDPLLPDLDDSPEALESLVDEAALRGARAVTATYVFAWGQSLRRLRRLELTVRSAALLSQRSPMEGGVAFSVPLERKLATYSRIAALARARGLQFNTCGCKDLRLRDVSEFATRCRNVEFLAERNIDVVSPASELPGSAVARHGGTPPGPRVPRPPSPGRRTTGP